MVNNHLKRVGCRLGKITEMNIPRQNYGLSAINNKFIFKYFMHKQMHLFNLLVHEDE